MDENPSPVTADLDAVRQRRRALRASMGELEAALAAPTNGKPADWAYNVKRALAQRQECMNENIRSTEGPDGFLQHSVSAAPRLVHTTTVAVEEHQVIVDSLRGLVIVVGAPVVDIDQIRGRCRSL